MAEYYPLLAKAVAGLPNSTPATRRAVYERARKALLAQLHNLQPPLSEADVAREAKALDMAMARLEADMDMASLEAELARAIGKPAAAPRPAVEARPAAMMRAASETGDSGAPGIPRAPLAARRSNGAAMAMEPARDRFADTNDWEPSGKNRDGERNQTAVDFDAPEPPRMRSEIMRPEVARPYAPQPESEDAPPSRRMWIVVAVVVIVVGMVDAAAWKLRDRLEDLAAFKSATQSQADQGGGKIAERIGGSPAPQPSSKAPAPGVSPAQTAVAPVASSMQKSADSTPSVPVAYRAALLVEAPDEPNKVKTYLGTVIWRLENVSSDSSQPPGTAVHADIDVPEDKLKATLEIQKNTVATLSASHTITIVFTIAPDSPTGGIKQISVPQLRNEDSANGEPLKGSLVPIMDNSFLIGLNRGDAESSNIGLIKQREWFDIPILLTNGRVAKLTFEKNASGDRAIEDASASWQAE